MADHIDIDTSSFARFARDLRRLEPEVNKELRRSLRAAGEIVAADARMRASGIHGVPERIKVRTSGTTIRVVVQDQATPHKGIGPAFENKGKAGTFRHPVYGHRDRWVPQGARPFLRPSLVAHRDAAVRAAEQALRDAMARVGFH